MSGDDEQLRLDGDVVGPSDGRVAGDVASALRPDQVPPHLANVWALVAGVARDRGAVVDDLADLERFHDLVAAFPDDGRSVTRSELVELAGLDGDPRVDQRFDTLVALGALRQTRAKRHTGSYVLNPVALIAAELLAGLATRGGVTRLHEMLVLAADRLDADDLEGDEAREICLRLTRVLHSFAADLERVVDLGTTADVVAARPGREADRAFERVELLAQLTLERFPSLRSAALGLWDAGERFNRAIESLVTRLVDEAVDVEVSGLFTVVDADALAAAARTAGHADLSQVARDVVVDAPRVVVDRETIRAGVEEAGRRPPERSMVDPPALAPDGEAERLVADRRLAEEHRAAARRRQAERVLGEQEWVELSDAFDGWPGAAQRLADALAVARDGTVPITVDLAHHLVVEPDGPVAVSFPLRLRRLAAAGHAAGHVLGTGVHEGPGGEP